MSFITDWALKRGPVTILAFVIVLAGGVATFRSLPVEVLPRVQFPLLLVSVPYQNAGAEDVVSDVTVPVEQLGSGLDGLKSVQSTSMEGVSTVLFSYQYGIDMDVAKKDLESRITTLELPGESGKPNVFGIDPGNEPILRFSITTDGELGELSSFVRENIEPELLGVDGVSKVELSGDQDMDIMVRVNSEKMSKYDLTLTEIARRMKESNFSIPSGAVFDSGRMLTIRTSHFVTTLSDLTNLPIGSYKGSVILINDVALVDVIPSPLASISRTNGSPSLGISVSKDPDANTVEVAEAALKVVEDAVISEGMEVEVIYNGGPDIENQLNTLFSEGLYGFLFAVTGVFLFLLNIRPGIFKGLTLSLRPTVVIAMTIPVSILGGVLLMGFVDLTLNIMTLGGLALAVGRVIDDSIVVLENVYRHMQRGEAPKSSAYNATKEVIAPITSSTLTSIVVFAPLAFIQGLVGEFFMPFCIAVTFALIASLVVSITFVPVVGAFLLKPGDILEDDEKTGGSLTTLQKIYRPVLEWSLGHKWATLSIALLLTVGSLGLLRFIPVTLFPSGGERVLTIDISLPPTSGQVEKEAVVLEVESALGLLLQKGDVENYLTTIGGRSMIMMPGATGLQTASIFVRLNPIAPANIADNLRGQFPTDNERKFTIEEIAAAGPPSGGLELKITGTSFFDVIDVTRQLVDLTKSIDGVENVESDLAGTRPELLVNVDPAAASGLGLSAKDLADQIGQLMRGQKVGSMLIDGRELKVMLTGGEGMFGGVEALRGVGISGPLGRATLGEVAHITISESPTKISRSDGKRAATVTGSITAGDTRAVQVEVEETIDELKLPQGVEIATGGIFSDIEQGFKDIYLAMAISVALVYIVLVASMGSLRNPFVILFSLPLAGIGALVGLAITGRSLGLPSMMGMLLLIGIVVTNAIVLISFVQQLRDRGMSVRNALVEGGLVRLRPILMTAVTTAFALLPLAAFVGNEGGGIIGEDLATVVIGGLASSTFLTLLIVPIMYEFMHSTLPRLFRRNKDSEFSLSNEGAAVD